MTSCRIELSISPLSNSEAERALSALRRTWQQPAWVHRQTCDDICLLSIRHEAELPANENANRFSERIAANLWRAIGRYARITLEVAGENGDGEALDFGEPDYRRILSEFRLSPRVSLT